MIRNRRLWALALVLVLPSLAGCVTTANFRKLEYEVNKLKAGGGGAPDATRVADLSSEIDALRDQLARLEGRLEVSEHQAQQALEEAQAARLTASQGGSMAPSPTGAAVPGTGPVGASGVPGGAPPPGASAELLAYREAYDLWRTDDGEACIDRFGQFLQAYPSSEYADDAAYWMADCYFKTEDYKTAILRFDDVASRHPQSEKAPEALYRQGEALLQLGPRYENAARKAFERLMTEYPNSPRVRDARNKLDAMTAGTTQG